MLNRILWGFLLFFLMISLVGCSTTVKITDNSTIRPTIMVSKNFTDRLGIQANVYGTEGTSSQTLDEDEEINIEEPPIEGPVSMDNEFSLVSGNLLFHFTMLDSAYVDLHLFAGLNTTILNLDFISENFRREFDVTSLMGTVSFQADAKITEDVTCSVSLKASASTEDYTRSHEQKFIVSYSFAPSFAVWGGWHFWHYEYYEKPSDIIIETSGPAVGVHVIF